MVLHYHPECYIRSENPINILLACLFIENDTRDVNVSTFTSHIQLIHVLIWLCPWCVSWIIYKINKIACYRTNEMYALRLYVQNDSVPWRSFSFRSKFSNETRLHKLYLTDPKYQLRITENLFFFKFLWRVRHGIMSRYVVGDDGKRVLFFLSISQPYGTFFHSIM